MRDFREEPRWDFLPPQPPETIPPADAGLGWPGDKVHPVKNPPKLAPYAPPAPPAHTLQDVLLVNILKCANTRETI